LGATRCLRTADGVERHVVPALEPLLHVPIGEAVAHVVDDGPWHEFSRLPGSGVTWSALDAVPEDRQGAALRCPLHCAAGGRPDPGMRLRRHQAHSLPTTMSGASGCFIPTM